MATVNDLLGQLSLNQINNFFCTVAISSDHQPARDLVLRPGPIMLFKLPIMLLSNAPKFSIVPNYAPLCLLDSLSESEDTISLTTSITIIALELAPYLISDNYFWKSWKEITSKDMAFLPQRYAVAFSSINLKFLPIMPILCSKLVYYAGIMLDALACLLCLKLCQHNWRRPSSRL